jgi:hypothetical protein
MAHKKSEPLKTVLTIVAGCLIIFLITQARLLVYLSLIIGLAALSSAALAKGIDYVWMKLARLLSFIMPTVLLSLVFFIILFPLALLSRLFKKRDPLNLSNRLTSTFVGNSKTFTAKSFEKPW